MGYCITSRAVGEALGVSKNSVTNWTKGLPRQRAEGVTAWQYMRLADLVPSIRARRLRGLHGDDLARVVALDTSKADAAQPLGDDADARAVALHNVLTDEERQRFARVTDQAAKAAGQALWGKGHLYNLGRCLGLLILRSEVLAYVLTGERREGFPDHTQRQWAEYMAQHVISTITPTERTALSG